MDEKPEVIQKEIEQTSTSLKEKVEMLEEQVLGTVKDATETVGDTVESVKDSVAETIQTVKETVHDIGDTLRRTFDLRYQVQRHPWPMMGGSVLAGFAAGKLLGRLVGGPREVSQNGSPVRAPSAATLYTSAPPAAAEPSRPGLFNRLLERVEPEIDKVKGMAIGAVFGLLRDMAKRSLPESLSAKVDEVMNSVTTKLGGEPIHGPVSEFSPGSHDGPR
jgi:ElaB/YqjD/DUF883 family membrane-anchored ribosome-binding protein